MKILLTLFILLFSSAVVADDISDFEIEGMSVGDSLLDYYNENEILNSIDNFQSDNTYTMIVISGNFEIYDVLEITFKTKDKKYIIEGLAGGVYYVNDFASCKKKQQEIKKELETLFPLKEPFFEEGLHTLDKSGQSKFYRYSFVIDPKSLYYEIQLGCFNFGKNLEDMGYADNLNLIIHTNELDEYLFSLEE